MLNANFLATLCLLSDQIIRLLTYFRCANSQIFCSIHFWKHLHGLILFWRERVHLLALQNPHWDLIPTQPWLLQLLQHQVRNHEILKFLVVLERAMRLLFSIESKSVQHVDFWPDQLPDLAKLNQLHHLAKIQLQLHSNDTSGILH
ncbi:unannotated protein [freshwater metagenome]|uniref:Unannotated protein n=1 Tax=freshwater metagenome TaxID=449393 RepID=A0A6J7TWM2_9ZZZZ